jgi:hypothetical protein
MNGQTKPIPVKIFRYLPPVENAPGIFDEGPNGARLAVGEGRHEPIAKGDFVVVFPDNRKKVCKPENLEKEYDLLPSEVTEETLKKVVEALGNAIEKEETNKAVLNSEAPKLEQPVEPESVEPTEENPDQEKLL